MTKELGIQGKKISYRVFGKGKPVVLVHGFGETSDVWENQIAFFKEKYQLIVPDLPGSRESELVDDMSIEGMAEVIKKVIDHEISSASLQDSAGQILLIGHSMGGYITLAFAEKYPAYLKGFGLFHSTAYPDSEEKKATRQKGIVFIRERGAFEFLKTSTPNLFSPPFKSENQGFIDGFIQSLNNFSAESLVYYYEAMIARPDRTAVLTNTKIPVLFILGEHDTAIPLQDTLKLCSLPEKAYIHILRKSGHMGMIEEAEYSNELLKNFFEGAWLF